MIQIVKNSMAFFLGLFLMVACQPEVKDKPAETPLAPKEVLTEEVKKIPTEEKLTEEKASAETAEKEEDKEEKKEEQVAEKVEEKPKPKPKPKKKRPKVSFDSKSFDYGVIMQGDKVEHNFKFTNTGKADLVIKNVKASCGCTQPTYPFIPIKPGKEGSIGVIFDSTGKLGRSLPTITVVTNARPSTYTLKLTGFVDAERAKDQPEQAKEETSDSETGEIVPTGGEGSL